MTSLNNNSHAQRAVTFIMLPALLIFLCFTARNQQALAIKTAQGSTDGNIPVLTYKYDNQRTGENTNETTLTLKNVNANDFGLRFSYPVDGQVYAQPLYMPQVTIQGKTTNLIIVATEHDSVYAFDADRASGSTAPIWTRTLLEKGAHTVQAAELGCSDLAPEIGITSTPVIDQTTATLFVVAFSKLGNRLFYQLHALDLSTGREKSGSPKTVQGPGTFNGAIERQRSALLLENGQIYLAFSSFCDHGPYHGWILGYKYDRHGFHLVSSYNNTPHGTEGGIWGAGNGISADTDGHIYTMSGNGTFDLDRGGSDGGDSFIQLDAHLHMVDYFTPFNQICLQRGDVDLGSGGPLIVPQSPANGKSAEVIGGGKEGRIYVLNIHHMGHYHTLNNPCANQETTRVDLIKQELSPHTFHSIFSTPTYWDGVHGAYVYIPGTKDPTLAFQLHKGYLTQVSSTSQKSANRDGNLVVSSNGSLPDTGILWSLNPGFLNAYDATDLKNRLYSSSLNDYNKFSNPIVVNGQVLVPTRGALKIYGLLTSTPPPTNSTATPTITKQMTKRENELI